jgi:glycosyltransferase involved in cell wall biosynthesis
VVLVVTDNRFWREQIGSQRRISSLCKHLKDQGHELLVIFAGYLYSMDDDILVSGRFPYRIESFGLRAEQSGGEGESLWTLARIRRTLQRVRSQGRATLSRYRDKSMSVGKRALALQWQEPKLQDFVDERVSQRFIAGCENYQPGLIIVEYVRLSYVLDLCRGAIPNRCRTLIDTHDVQFERQERYHARGQIHDIDITAAEEARALSLADAVIAIQATDARKLLDICPKLKVIVAGFPETICQHAIRENPGNVVRIAFFGSDMPPNRDAASVLVRRIFPSLRKRFGERVELHLYGKVCDGFSSNGTVPGLVLHGFVDDLAAAYAEVDLLANFIAFGGGLKIKNVEALCHGRALLTTPVGAEGLEGGAGKVFWVADGEAAFAAQLAVLVEDDLTRYQLATEALAFARRHLSADVVYADFDAFVKGEMVSDVSRFSLG